MSNADAGQGGGDGGGDDPDCSGYGETWGPGIGPPPDGCGGGPPGGQGQSSESSLIAIPWFKAPPDSGAVILSLLALAVVAGSRFESSQIITESASSTSARDRAGITL